MKFKINPLNNTMELNTFTLTAFCSLCGKFIGSVEVVDDSDVLGFYTQNTVCNTCFKAKGLVSVKALLADYHEEKEDQQDLIDTNQQK